ncbi:MAG: outer membrane lipoprotein-sorting protein, partial [Myxococcota bacterium]
DSKNDGAATLRIQCTPKPDSAIEYDRIDIVVRLRDHMPLRQEFFDHKGKRTRAMLYQDFKKMGGRLVPTTLVVVPDDKPGEKTTVTYHDLVFNVPMPESTFSLSQLRKR